LLTRPDVRTGHRARRQERNIHGKLFGGYLMRQAYELAFCAAEM